MKLCDFPAKEKIIHERKMSLGQLRLGALQILNSKRYWKGVEIRLVDVFDGEVEKFKGTNQFLMADMVDAMMVNLISIKFLDIYNEEQHASIKTMIIVIDSHVED